HEARLRGELGASELALADAVRHGMLRDRDDGDGGVALRSGAVRDGTHVVLAAAGGSADLRGPGDLQDGARAAADLGSDAAAEVGDLDGGVRVVWRRVRRLLDGPGDR